jgi:5'-nucleotidase / UDP-sugar diphosphatase
MLTRRLLLWLFVALAPLWAQEGVRHLTILHSNDLHGHLLPDDMGMGGFAQLATAVRHERENCAACLYLHAGDLVQGTPVSTLFRGVPVYQIANLLGFDASTVGNHDFDYGWRKTLEFARIANYPLVSANIVDAKGTLLTGKPYVIQTVGQIRVAIIGVVLGDLVGSYITAETAGPWHVLPVVETVRRYAAEVRDRADLIVVLGHIHDKDEVAAILREVPDVAVVIAGHSHVAYKEPMNVDGRVAVLVDGYGSQLGRLDLDVDMATKKLRSATWKKIAIDSKQFEAAPDVARIVKKWEDKASKVVDVPIGESKRRFSVVELRALVARAMIEETGTDLAFVNKGNVRDVLPAGTILARQIWNMLPFDNRMVIGKFKGSQLPKTVTEGHEIDPNREYTLVTTDFSAANQASEGELNSHGLEFPKTVGQQRDAMIDWIKKKKIVE